MACRGCASFLARVSNVSYERAMQVWLLYGSHADPWDAAYAACKAGAPEPWRPFPWKSYAAKHAERVAAARAGRAASVAAARERRPPSGLRPRRLCAKTGWPPGGLRAWRRRAKTRRP